MCVEKSTALPEQASESGIIQPHMQTKYTRKCTIIALTIFLFSFMFLLNHLAEFIYYVIFWPRKSDIFCFSLVFSIFAQLLTVLLNVFYHYSMTKDSTANRSLWRLVCNTYDLPRRFSRDNFLFPVFLPFHCHSFFPRLSSFDHLLDCDMQLSWLVSLLFSFLFLQIPFCSSESKYTMLMSRSSPSYLSYFPAHVICHYWGLNLFRRIFTFLFFSLCILQHKIDIVLMF